MRRFLVLALVACSTASPPSAPDAGGVVGPCAGRTCGEDERCLARDDSPVPTCVAADDCHAVPLADDLVGNALAAVGRTRCEATIPEDFLPNAPEGVKHDPWRLAHYAALHHEPLRLPAWSDRLVEAMGRPDAFATSRGILEGAKRLGFELDPARPTYSPDPDAPLAKAVAYLVARRGGSANLAAISADAADVPAAIQAKVAPIVLAFADAADARDAAFSKVADLEAFYRGAPGLILATPGAVPPNPAAADVRALMLTGIDWRRLYQAAYALAAAVEDSGLTDETGATGFAFDQPTPMGRVVLGDAGPQTYEGKIAFLLDFGGSDTYRTPAGGTDGAQMGASLLVDLAGNDAYGYAIQANPLDAGRMPSDDGGRGARGSAFAGQSLSDHVRQGAGRCGIGLAFDYAGLDRYESPRFSQGFAAFGVGVLHDFAGDDTYTAEAGAQGAAMFGIGLLIDDAGEDTRTIYTYGQGFGYAGGFGALVDGAGDDAYLANGGDPAEGGDPLYPSAQLPGRGNNSFVQGAGFGRREDTGESAMSGGIGLLADFGGDDRYQCSVFGQGAGYWFGTGVFHDESGKDRYDGKWYVQGAAAHFALASFHDRAGDDDYRATSSTSLGVGHDWSVAFLVDDAGNDAYSGPGLSLGAGNACGWGVLVDGAGDDAYAAPGRTMGAFGDPKSCSYAVGATVGLFVDARGVDTYEIAGKPVERGDRVTVAEPQADAPDAKAAAVDGTGALLLLP